jgi:O-antigen ligase
VIYSEADKSPKAAPRIEVLLTGIFIITWFLQINSRVAILGAVRFEFVLGAILAAFAIPRYLEKSNPATVKLKRTAYLYLSVLLFYTLYSQAPEISLQTFEDRILKFSMIYFFIAAFVRESNDLLWILAAMLLAWLKLGQEAFTGWASGSLVWENQGVMRLHGSIPLLEHPNSLAGFAVGCLPFSYYLYPLAQRRAVKLVLLAIATFSLVTILFTASRTGYVATLFVVIFILRERKTSYAKTVGLLFVLLIGAALVVPSDYVERFQSIFTMREREGQSSARRLEIIDDAISVYAAYPMGVGVAAFPEVRGRMFGRFQDTHNLYLQVLTNSGPLGLLIFLNFVWITLQSFNKVIHGCEGLPSRKNSGALGWMPAIARAFKLYVLIRLVLGIFGMDQYEIYWWIAAGVAFSQLGILQRELDSNRLRERS